MYILSTLCRLVAMLWQRSINCQLLHWFVVLVKVYVAIELGTNLCLRTYHSMYIIGGQILHG